LAQVVSEAARRRCNKASPYRFALRDISPN